MDPEIQQLPVAALPVAGGVVVGVLVARITADRTRQLERERWRRELYASYIHAVDGVRDAFHLGAGGSTPEEDWGDHLDRAGRLFVEIKMTAPSIAEPATRVYEAVSGLVKLLRIVASGDNGDAVVTMDVDAYRSADEACRLANARFIEAAAREFR